MTHEEYKVFSCKSNQQFAWVLLLFLRTGIGLVMVTIAIQETPCRALGSLSMSKACLHMSTGLLQAQLTASN